MLTEPVAGYMLVTRCKQDPSEGFAPVGGIKVHLDLENLERSGDGYVIPVAVVKPSQENKYNLKAGDVVYVNPKFLFQTVIEGGIYFFAHEGYLMAKLDHEHARTAGAVAAPINQPQFKPRIAKAGPLDLAALEAAKGR